MHALTGASIAGVTVCLAMGIATSGASAQDALKAAALQHVIQNSQHDIVVIDTNLKVVADTIAANVGTVFAEDAGKEVAQTIKDGQPRTFVEKGKDYPQGLRQRVFAIKDGTGKIVGAVVVSADLIKR
jgi:hypothetical protein